MKSFYGRPWSMEQRMVLFKWMQGWGLNVYMYGPKDDLKHRLLWRETYSVEESAQLKALVLGAQECGIEFVYAISPGQDITFSSSCDLTLLKQKLRQVKGFGCMAFAILFDDIDHAMCPTDKEAFSSFAHAQTSVANEIYRYLGEPPVFLFCPTEYCSSLCYPSLSKSCYLKVIGDDLHPGIVIIWTGTTVISKEITPESVQEVQDVIKRRPLIWDNLHANDYAQRRVFLGPYRGRPSSLVSKLHGMLLNPNCELEANYIPIHTLATWFRCGKGTETEDGEKGTESCHPYCPNEALNLALDDWVKEVNRRLCPSRQLLKEEVEGQLRSKLSSVFTQNGNIEPRTEKPSTSTTDLLPQRSPTKELELGKTRDVPSLCEQTQEGPEMSLGLRSVTEVGQEAESEKTGPGDSEKDGTLPTPEKQGVESVGTVDLDRPKPLSGSPAGNEGCGAMERDGAEGGPEQDEGGDRVSPAGRTLPLTGALTLDDLRLMVDLFHLPYEHGEETAGLLREFHWLKTNSDFVSANTKMESKKAEEWRSRSCAFQLACDRIVQLYRQFMSSPNRAIVYDLYPYLWDIRNTLLVAKAFIMWLDGRIERDTYSFNSWMNCFQWCRTGSAPVVLGMEGETWIYRGGLAGEFQMMLPVTSSNDLFNQPPPLFPTLKSYTIRPFFQEDKNALYSMCREMHNAKSQEKDQADVYPDLIGDRYLGCFLTLCPDYCFILEDEEGPCSCACGALEVRSFLKGCEVAWLPAMQEKYSKPTALNNLTPTQELKMFFHNKIPSFPDSLLYHFPSLIQLNVQSQMLDSSEARNLVICLMSALKANGSQGVFCELKASKKQELELYVSLGFLELPGAEVSTPEGVIFGRLL
ncbi:protein O-GlcNAcase isoform X2 [Carcharodon carcharias]|uniref:protein O-GlcNAcase isoform X2 n=1 Tax=Carcharodon carcharias TaxID=13397 RepID=UPI001B7DD062|nr:protein O-GlcNAcase isoform X2 [Carcharodon carcharias]